MQRFAIKLELENFGDEAIVLQANERVTETERVSAQQQLRARALRQDAEAQVAAQIIRDLQGTTRLVAAESAPPAPADPALAAVVEEMLELLGNAMCSEHQYKPFTPKIRSTFYYDGESVDDL